MFGICAGVEKHAREFDRPAFGRHVQRRVVAVPQPRLALTSTPWAISHRTAAAFSAPPRDAGRWCRGRRGRCARDPLAAWPRRVVALEVSALMQSSVAPAASSMARMAGSACSCEAVVSAVAPARRSRSTSAPRSSSSRTIPGRFFAAAWCRGVRWCSLRLMRAARQRRVARDEARARRRRDRARSRTRD